MTKITISNIIKVPTKEVFDSYLNADDNRRWNTAGNGWTTGKTIIDSVVGKRWETEYVSPDRLNDFIFGGTYTEIIPFKKIGYAMNQADKPIAPQDRKVEVLFEELEDNIGTKITVIFDAEDQHPLEFQKAGWQQILNNFTNFIERKNNPEYSAKINSIVINSTKELVWKALLDKENYKLWAVTFQKDSYYEGEIKYDSEIKFLDIKGSGISSIIKVCIPNYQISFEHQHEIKDFKDDLTSEANSYWKGLKETYTIIEQTDKTILLEIYFDFPAAWIEEISNAWPKALAIIKEIAEK